MRLSGNIKANPARRWISFVFLGAAINFVVAADHRIPVEPASPAPIICFDELDLATVRIEEELQVTLLPPIDVTVTAYSSTVGQTDSTPFITASMTHVRPGVIALSRDLIRRYNPNAPFAYGDQVVIEGHGIFTVEDTMNQRYSKRADIWFPSTSEALQFGKQQLTLTLASAASTEDAAGISGGGITGSSPRSASAPSR